MRYSAASIPKLIGFVCEFCKVSEKLTEFTVNYWKYKKQRITIFKKKWLVQKTLHFIARCPRLKPQAFDWMQAHIIGGASFALCWSSLKGTIQMCYKVSFNIVSQNDASLSLSLSFSRLRNK